MTDTIYVVLGTTGEYSDRMEWVVRAFRNEKTAQDQVEFLTEKWAALKAGLERYTDEYRNAEKAMTEWDPNFYEDYTGTSWWMSDGIPLDD